MSIAFLFSTQGLLQYSKLGSEALRLLQQWGQQRQKVVITSRNFYNILKSCSF